MEGRDCRLGFLAGTASVTRSYSQAIKYKVTFAGYIIQGPFSDHPLYSPLTQTNKNKTVTNSSSYKRMKTSIHTNKATNLNATYDLRGFIF